MIPSKIKIKILALRRIFAALGSKELKVHVSIIFLLPWTCYINTVHTRRGARGGQPSWKGKEFIFGHH